MQGRLPTDDDSRRPDEAPAATLMYAPVPVVKGRGTVWALEHRFSGHTRQALDDGWQTLRAAAGGSAPSTVEPDDRDLGEAAAPITEVSTETVRSIVSANESPDIGFDLSLNPYRGCEHGCIYCYARPTHSYLNLSPGVDFETRIVAKINAAEKLRETLTARGYTPSLVNIGSVTDAYQPVERRLRITRAVIEVLVEARHPFSIITKSGLVERDIDLIAPMAAERRASVQVSITTLDAALARSLEPRAASPQRRLRCIETLARAGIPVGVSVSPVIPFLNEPELERILQAARDAGARRASSIVLRLPWEVSPLFQHWLQQHVPDRAERIMARVREMRGGQDNDSRFGTRMTGQGVWAQLLRQRFDKACVRLRLNQERRETDVSAFRPPGAHAGQGQLF